MGDCPSSATRASIALARSTAACSWCSKIVSTSTRWTLAAQGASSSRSASASVNRRLRFRCHSQSAPRPARTRLPRPSSAKPRRAGCATHPRQPLGQSRRRGRCPRPRAGDLQTGHSRSHGADDSVMHRSRQCPNLVGPVGMQVDRHRSRSPAGHRISDQLVQRHRDLRMVSMGVIAVQSALNHGRKVAGSRFSWPLRPAHR
jgi:hypothetical protein